MGKPDKKAIINGRFYTDVDTEPSIYLTANNALPETIHTVSQLADTKDKSKSIL